MKNKTVYSILCGTLAGVILYYLQLVAYYLLFPCLSEGTGFLLVVTIAVGTLFTGATIFVQNRSFWHSLLRWLVLTVSFVLATVVNGYLGIVSNLLEWKGTVGIATQNVIGMLILTTTVVIFCATLIIVLIRGIVVRINDNIKTGK